jgi:chorismate mutase/prephenate dehydratase
MNRIESRPSHAGRWQYAFFIDVSGHVQDDSVGRALSELGDYAADVKVLGSYPVALG